MFTVIGSSILTDAFSEQTKALNRFYTCRKRLVDQKYLNIHVTLHKPTVINF